MVSILFKGTLGPWPQGTFFKKISASLRKLFPHNAELSRLLKAMNDLKISHVSAEDSFAGIDMKIYFGDYKALLYVNNVAGIKNERWKSYVTSGKRFDDNWYYVKDELE